MTDSRQEEVKKACGDGKGSKTTLASLAVAMADEIGRWDPLNDLVLDEEGRTRLSPTAMCLKNDCANTKAILGQQDFTVDRHAFDNEHFSSVLDKAFDREAKLLKQLNKQNPEQLPPAHKLTKVGGPSDLGLGACGAHYIFQVDHPDGTPLTPAEADGVRNALCFFGQESTRGTCGNNDFIGFTQTQVDCPDGRVCVAIDPDPNDNGTIYTTTPGEAPVYPMNRLYDPSNTYLGTACTMTTGRAGTMRSKCSTMPTTCGYLYCMFNN
jgi:hypothetical protein